MLKVASTAGNLPTALAMLERHAVLGARPKIPALLTSSRDWCAVVLQSHVTQPSLIYFRSAATGCGWPATLGALMDLALLHELVIDGPQSSGAAVLLREHASRLAKDVCNLVGLQPAPVATAASDVRLLQMRLRDAGYRLHENVDVARFTAMRGELLGSIAALSRHLDAAATPLLNRRRQNEECRDNTFADADS